MFILCHYYGKSCYSCFSSWSSWLKETMPPMKEDSNEISLLLSSWLRNTRSPLLHSQAQCCSGETGIGLRVFDMLFFFFFAFFFLQSDQFRSAHLDLTYLPNSRLREDGNKQINKENLTLKLGNFMSLVLSQNYRSKFCSKKSS